MIKFINLPKEEPYLRFIEQYNNAIVFKQKYIEAVAISSFNKSLNEVNSRYVNLKYIKDKEWVFYSNYESPKSKDFQSHKQICATFFWNSINVQIRLKAKIKKISQIESDEYFANRDPKKNALAISSSQSSPIESYKKIQNRYNEVLNSKDLKKRPKYWGGYKFMPYSFEFWYGHHSRVNKRDLFELKKGEWNHYFLQP